ncbi:MAG: hypothetical protein ACLQLH_00050 [Terracidiphilus sp.]
MAFGSGFNVGEHYKINPVASIGLAYHSPIWFQQSHGNARI